MQSRITYLLLNPFLCCKCALILIPTIKPHFIRCNPGYIAGQWYVLCDSVNTMIYVLIKYPHLPWHKNILSRNKMFYHPQLLSISVASFVLPDGQLDVAPKTQKVEITKKIIYPVLHLGMLQAIFKKKEGRGAKYTLPDPHPFLKKLTHLPAA